MSNGSKTLRSHVSHTRPFNEREQLRDQAEVGDQITKTERAGQSIEQPRTTEHTRQWTEPSSNGDHPPAGEALPTRDRHRQGI